MGRGRFFLSCFVGCVLLGVSPAQAAFLFCNETKIGLEAAFGYREGGVWISEGWWQIQPGQCARVYNKALDQRFYFYHARPVSELENKVWEGKYSFCTDKKAFRIEGDNQCAPRGYQRSGFQEVDIGNGRRDYTLTFRDQS